MTTFQDLNSYLSGINREINKRDVKLRGMKHWYHRPATSGAQYTYSQFYSQGYKTMIELNKLRQIKKT